jgi:hypothetical protein
MKTQDFAPVINSDKLAENLVKQFNTKVNLNSYDREQLEDIRNKLRTKIFQQEGSSKFNDLLTNETYQKDKAMLELLNTRIKEMLGEQMKKLRDKMDQLNEAKSEQADKKKCPPMSHIKKMCQDGKSVAEICKMHPDCDQKELKQMVADCKEKMDEGKKAKPDFLDLDKDGNKTEPMKKAAKDAKVKEGFPTVDDARAEHEKNKTTDKFDKKELAPGVTRYTRKASTFTDGGDDSDVKKAKDKAKKNAKVKESKSCANGHTKMTKDCDECMGMYEASHQEKTTMKHVKNPTTGEKKAAKDIKPGVAGYKDRVDMLKSAEADGRLKNEGKDEGKPGKNFAKIAKDAGKRYGSKAAGERVAGAVRNKLAKQGKLEESQFKHNVRFVNESIGFLLQEDEEAKAKIITAAGDIVNDFTGWMQRIGQYQTKAIIELADSIRADFGAAEAEAFKQKVVPSLATSLETLTQQREILSNAVAQLAGEAVPETPMGMEPNADMDAGLDIAKPDSMNTNDEFAASDAAAGGAETAGRELRESRAKRRARKLAESHSILTKLAR